MNAFLISRFVSLFFGLVLCALFAGTTLGASQVKDRLLMGQKPAARLSDYGLFTGPGLERPDERVVRYTISNPLFTDYALKDRFLYLPIEAKPATYQTEGVLDFPVGSVLVKTFSYPESFKDPQSPVRKIETRLLIHKETGWVGYPYVWNDDQTDAVLKLAGKRLKVDVIWKNGEKDVISYAVPNKNQCKGCHGDKEKRLAPIGPKIRNLNKTSQSGSGNQVHDLIDRDYIEGPKRDTGDMPKVPFPFNSEEGALVDRARSYLDGNCAHCHAPGRAADTSGLYLGYLEKREVHWGLEKPPVAAGRGSGGLLVDIDPGHPEKSILVFRMKSNDPGIMMPETGRSMIDKEGVALIEAFIRQLD
ncbi:SO2930 family diheme c-type cytochrome [Sneathiella aquimaris]|uniref:SO2930 family diheme c-type cytochrome n=1 Tax=Sneathiella aquimaris TaxID=2599305 RepID=UPI00146BD1D2|nr:SO2930 family diheme c-type cytochrome [Sneathiella aquimaris]